MKILVTGGLGYIGSHVTVELIQNGYSVTIIDNLINSKIEVLDNIKKIVGKKDINFFNVDIRDKENLNKIFSKINFHSVIHCAGLKIISESIISPYKYYDYNLNGTMTLCKMMEKYGVKNLIFSSSASVYDPRGDLPIKETNNLLPYNVYGRTKLYTENFLKDLQKTKKDWNIIVLRYFNPVSAHPSGIIGEIPSEKPTNLLPLISLVAIGKYSFVNIFGKDYDTDDGTAIRDFIHVVDLAKGHIKSMSIISENNKSNLFNVINLGTGRGYSVLEMIKTFQKVTNIKINFKIKPRRSGDISTSFANVDYAKKIMSWNTEFDLKKICSDQWKFVSKHKQYFL